MSRYFNDFVRQSSQETNFPLQQQSVVTDLNSRQNQVDFEIVDEYGLSIEKMPYLDLNETEHCLNSLANKTEQMKENFNEHVVDKSLYSSSLTQLDNMLEIAMPAYLRLLETRNEIVDTSLFVESDFVQYKSNIKKKVIKQLKTIDTRRKKF